MSKKIFFIITFIILLILLILFLLSFFMKQKTEKDLTFTESLKEFFPFGKSADNTGFIGNGENSEQNGGVSNNAENRVETGSEMGEPKIPRLRHITTVPTAGAVIIERERTLTIGKITKKIKEYFVRYIYRGNGHIEEIKTSSFDVTKISNTTIPKIYEAVFSLDGKSFIARFLGDNTDDIKTYSATLKPIVATSTEKTATTTLANLTKDETKLEEVVGKYIDLNIKEIAYSPNRANILSLFTSGDRGDIVLSGRSGENKKTLYSSPLREWLLSYPTDGTAVISTKPSGLAYGFAYKLNLGNGALSKIAGNLPGLTVLSGRNLSYMLLGTGGSSVSVSIVKTDSPASSLQVINTLPEKCVWAKKDEFVVFCAVPKSIPRGTYPDDWYKGIVSFEDDIWKINVKTGFSSLVVSPKSEGKSIDVVNMDISNVDNYLTFINKNDLTLWGYDITDEVNKKIDFGVSTSTATSTTR